MRIFAKDASVPPVLRDTRGLRVEFKDLRCIGETRHRLLSCDSPSGRRKKRFLRERKQREKGRFLMACLLVFSRSDVRLAHRNQSVKAGQGSLPGWDFILRYARCVMGSVMVRRGDAGDQSPALGAGYSEASVALCAGFKPILARLRLPRVSSREIVAVERGQMEQGRRIHRSLVRWELPDRIREILQTREMAPQKVERLQGARFRRGRRRRLRAVRSRARGSINRNNATDTVCRISHTAGGNNSLRHSAFLYSPGNHTT
ncbi:MAG: hypothetical protein V2G42_06950 [bacterium JZ-2024 1]